MKEAMNFARSIMLILLPQVHMTTWWSSSCFLSCDLQYKNQLGKQPTSSASGERKKLHHGSESFGCGLCSVYGNVHHHNRKTCRCSTRLLQDYLVRVNLSMTGQTSDFLLLANSD